MKTRNALYLTVLAGALLVPAGAVADTPYDWTFAGPNISGSGTLTAIASGTSGLDYITGGSGTVNYNGDVLAVTFGLCADPAATCTVVNTDGAGANLTYDNELFINNSPGAELDDNGIVLTPTPLAGYQGTSYVGVWDSPSQSFYGWGSGQYVNLSTPFTISAVPDGGTTLALLGLAIAGMAGLRRKLSI